MTANPNLPVDDVAGRLWNVERLLGESNEGRSVEAATACIAGAQVHSTVALVHEVGRVADALERLVFLSEATS